MRHLTDAGNPNLHWTQTRLFDSTYQLMDGDAVFARLSFPKVFGSLAVAETADGAWTFKRTGFWHTRATVRREGSDSDVAVFDHSTWSGGGTLTLADGRKVQFTTNFWQSRIECQTEDGQLLFRYQTEGFMRLGATLELAPAATSLPELSWLLAFGWYLVVMIQHDAATQGVVIS